MFSWLEGLVSSIASSIGGVFEGIGDTIVNAIWDNLVKWLFNAFYDSIADVFTQMGGMGAGNYGGRTHDMCADFIRWQQDGWRILVLSGGTARGERMRQSFEDEGVKAAFDELGSAAPQNGECRIYPLTLSGGFQYPEIKVAVIASGDVYGAKSAKGRPKKQQGSKIASFTDLNVGDYVVHETHGIGIYQGTKRLTSEGASRDYLLVQYLGSD